MPIVIALLATAAVMLLASSLSTAVEIRSTARRSKRAVREYEIVDVREQEMLESIGERVVRPVAEHLLALARQLTPAGYVETVKRNIVLAGSPPGHEVDRFLILKVLGAASVVLWIALAWIFLSSRPFIAIVAVSGASALCFFAPDINLRGRTRRRREEIERRLPDLLDLLVISVEAGLGFEQALDRVASTIPGPLSEEFRRMLQETRMGASRADALRALDERTQVDDLRTFILAILQADTFGVSIARILRTQADEIRTRRRQHAQEKSQKAPIRMLFPLVTCIFPAIFVMLLLPAVIQIFEKL